MHIMASEAGRNKTAILAVSLAVMNAGWMLPQITSGFLKARLGYTGLFIIPLLPMPRAEGSAGNEVTT